MEHPYPRERTWADAEAELSAVTLTKDETIRLQAEEIERLRADLLTADGQAQELQGEIARLRGLLREHLDGPKTDMTVREAHEWHDDYLRRVREALGDE